MIASINEDDLIPTEVLERILKCKGALDTIDMEDVDGNTAFLLSTMQEGANESYLAFFKCPEALEGINKQNKGGETALDFYVEADILLDNTFNFLS